MFAVVQRCQVRHIHSLGRVFSARLGGARAIRRVVLAELDAPGTGVHSITRLPRTKLCWDGLHGHGARLQGRAVQCDLLGRLVPQIWRQVRCSHVEAPRWLRSVAQCARQPRLWSEMECCRCWPPKRLDWGDRASCARAGFEIRNLLQLVRVVPSVVAPERRGCHIGFCWGPHATPAQGRSSAIRAFSHFFRWRVGSAVRRLAFGGIFSLAVQ